MRFAEEGAKVVVADVDLERAKETVQLIEDAGGTAVADRCDVSQEADVEATIALAVSTFGRLDIIFNNVGVPTPRPGLIFEEHTVDDFDRLFAINAKGVFLGSKHAILQFKEQGDGGVILNTGSVAGLVSWGGSVYGSTKGAVHQLTKAAAIEGAPFDIRCNAICPAGMPFTNFTNAMGLEVPTRTREQMAQGVGSMHPLGRPITAEDCAEAAVYLVSDHGQERHRRAPAGRRRVRRGERPPSRAGHGPTAHRRASCSTARSCGGCSTCAAATTRSPVAATPTTRIRCGTASASRPPCTRACVHELTGYPGDWFFQGLPYPDRPHFSAFSFDGVRRRLPRRRPVRVVGGRRVTSTPASRACSTASCAMNGMQHRRYRALVQPSFVPAKAQWWINNWIEHTVHSLIDQFVDDGHAELNVDFAAAIPVLTITGSFGVERRAGADHPRVPHERLAAGVRRSWSRSSPPAGWQPTDDLISVLVEAEYTDEDGVLHRLTDAEIYSFAMLLLAAGSGTTWKQMGITLAAILERPDVLAAVQRRPHVGAVRPSTSRCGGRRPTRCSRGTSPATPTSSASHLPQGSVLHLCLGAANRDPARWERPDEYDITRAPKPALAFGNGPHVCLGMHVARAEMNVGITALLDRLPNLRLDPDAEPPKYIGFYERGATAIPVVFD